VECEPADNIVVRVSDYRVSDEGWIRLSFKNVAGDAGVSKVEVTTSKIAEVSHHHVTRVHELAIADVVMAWILLTYSHCPSHLGPTAGCNDNAWHAGWGHCGCKFEAIGA
jgi:hypothetical protein